MTDDLPELCREGEEPNRFALFAKLRTMWRDAGSTIEIDGEEEARSYASLARYLGVPKQAVTQWATGSGGKAPAPWHVIIRLCYDLGLGIAIEPSGAKLYRLPS
jgi:hypothetical protein